MSFGVFGAVPLVPALRRIRMLEAGSGAGAAAGADATAGPAATPGAVLPESS
jgi:hypothetical protein